MMFIKQIFYFTVISVVSCGTRDNVYKQCSLPDLLIQEIKGYQPLVDSIIKQILTGPFKGSTYKELAKFVDKFGSRLAGTQNLENAIDYMLNASRANKLDNVHGEEVTVNNWERGNESAFMLKPRFQKISMTGLGSSIGTPPEGIVAEVLVVQSFEELEIPAVSEKAKGRIVLFVPEYVSYGVTVKYRYNAAVKAAQHGAVASLIRSVTPFSLATPHTGWQNYQENVTKIPTAAITVEDAHMLKRIYNRGEKIVIKLKMDAKNLDQTVSRNTVAEIIGREKPNQTVFVSGHLDSWDVGQGAMDDGGGAFISWNALVILRALNLTPRRTLRVVLWTAEEQYLVGAKGYAKKHKNETDNFVFMMESDEGTFNPYGLQYSAGKNGSCIIEEILQLFKGLNATQGEAVDNPGPDISLWTEIGVPGASPLNENEKYFWYHHTAADTMDVETPDNLDKNTAIWASFAYIIADLSQDFPRD